jgi:hypothetical protein
MDCIQVLSPEAISKGNAFFSFISGLLPDY